MRVIMTGGGTGGHIYPAIAIANKIRDRSNDSQILFVGTKHGLEKDLVPKEGYDIRFITVSGLDRKNLVRNVKVLNDYRKGKKQAAEIISEFKPDIVIGTGGYVSGPVVKTAAQMGVKCYIQEQNAFPGVTNKMLEKSVENVFLGFEEAARFFKHPEKHVVTGNPVRSEFFTADKAASRKLLKISDDDFVVLAFGGSQGAGRINKAMLDVIKKYNDVPGVQVFFATGRFYHLPIMNELRDMGIHIGDNIHIKEYIDDMNDYLAACDLVVSRSGALTVSEITLCSKPSILIPSPNVTGDHQTFNARAISDKGGAVLLEESKLSGEVLCSEIERLENNSEAMDKMAEISGKCAPVDAADIIYYTIIA